MERTYNIYDFLLSAGRIKFVREPPFGEICHRVRIRYITYMCLYNIYITLPKLYIQNVLFRHDHFRNFLRD